MDRTHKLIFANSATTQDIIAKISAFLQLSWKWIHTKFGWHGSKNMLAMPIRSFRGYLLGNLNFGRQETLSFVQSRFLLGWTTGENLVFLSLISFEKFKFEWLDFSQSQLWGKIFLPYSWDSNKLNLSNESFKRD